ncbi:hypothetical protein [Achromobacter sp. AONIH1]|uniref:hypothetical protein n=1 Tax=Achromobacter sp. AONIH1 TaxID=1758194 RepID=UPI000CD26512|nr:hypothetical protein [Achromobacter sp. AONIH1]AUT46278.1 hypothetical protein C2U31_09935 [Achromobacter sp. AONIH1]
MTSLRDIGLSQGLVDHLAADDQSGPFGYRCQPAHYWKSSPIAERDIVALWESGTVLNYFDQARRRFEQCSLEDIDAPWHSFTSLQGALAVLFITGYEDELSDEVLRDYARSFDFRHIERMLAEVPQAPEAYEHWRQTFPVSCA